MTLTLRGPFRDDHESRGEAGPTEREQELRVAEEAHRGAGELPQGLGAGRGSAREQPRFVEGAGASEKGPRAGRNRDSDEGEDDYSRRQSGALDTLSPSGCITPCITPPKPSGTARRRS